MTYSIPLSRITLLTILVLATAPLLTQSQLTGIYRSGRIDFNKNGKIEAAKKSIGQRIANLLGQMKCVVEPGKFEVLIGSSSEDIRIRKAFMIQ